MTPHLPAKSDNSIWPRRRLHAICIPVEDRVFGLLLYSLIALFAFLAFYNRGALGVDESVRRGGLLIASNVIILAYCSVVKGQKFTPLAPMLTLLTVWMVWLSFLSLHDLSDGGREVLKSWMEVLYCPLYFLGFYALTFRNPSGIRKTVSFFCGMLALNSVLFFYVMRFQMGERASFGFAHLNDVYYILLLLPWAMTVQNRTRRNALLILAAIVIFLSFKRTAFLATLASLTIFVLAERSRAGTILFKIKWLISALVLGSVMLFLYATIEERTDNYISNRFFAISYDEGGGRLEIFRSAWSALRQRSVPEWLVGAGHDGFRKNAEHIGRRGNPLSAHNDWLEVAYNYGALGIILFTAMNVIVIWRALRMNRERFLYGPSMLASYFVFLFMTMTSHLVLYPTYYSYLMAYWGAMFALHDRRNSQKQAFYSSPPSIPHIIQGYYK